MIVNITTCEITIRHRIHIGNGENVLNIHTYNMHFLSVMNIRCNIFFISGRISE